MNVRIITFSQTGNTRKVAKAMAGAMRELGHEVRHIPFKKVARDDFRRADLVGLGAPCFESQAPTPVRQFLASLPSLLHTRAFVFATSGGAPGRVLQDIARPLKRKGASVLGGFLCRGTCYHPVPCLKGRFPDRPNEDDLEKARRFARSVVALAAAGETSSSPDENRTDLLTPGWGLYDLVGHLLKDPLVRLLMPKPAPEAHRCDQCECCVRECPTGSIILDPAPRIGKACIRCYRCLTGCPRRALNVDWRIGNAATWSLYNETFERWFGDIEPVEKAY
ncbi:MAG: EFR1 family ferrodoxin [Desulfobacterales bacterium]|nr:EFR1 family ferrodoxin [Desulfobacterales bacterium]